MTMTIGKRVAMMATQIMVLICTLALVFLTTASAASASNVTRGYNPKDPYLIKKANALNNNPQKIFEFVRDEIRYEPYQGVLRGARGTLWSGAGNSIDQASLLSALLEISGYQTNYAQGTLVTEQAKKLILSVFEPNVYRVVGFVDDETKKANPQNDQSLINQIKAHVWIEANMNNKNVSLDPTFNHAKWGQAFTQKQSTFKNIPNNLLHQVTVKLIAKQSYSLSSAAGYGPSANKVLDATFNVADLTGKAISIGHERVSNIQNTMIGANIQHTYTPFININENDDNMKDDPNIIGQAYSEIPRSIAGILGNSQLSGLQLVIESKYQQNITVYKRTIHDSTVKLAGKTRDPKIPLLDRTDRFTFIVSGIANFFPKDQLNRQGFNKTLAKIQSLTKDVELISKDKPSESDNAKMSEFIAYSSYAANIQNILLAARFGDLSHQLQQSLDQLYLTKSYPDKPQILLVKTQVVRKNQKSAPKTSIDLVNTSVQTLINPNQSTIIKPSFNMMRSIVNIEAEHSVIAQLSQQGNHAPININRVFAQAKQENIDLITIDKVNSSIVADLDIIKSAKERISQSIANGHVILMPEKKVTVNGQKTIAWYALNPTTGNITDYNENGEHFSALEWVSLIKHNLEGADIWKTGVSPIFGFTLGSSAYIQTVLSCYVPGFECDANQQKATKESAFGFAEEMAGEFSKHFKDHLDEDNMKLGIYLAKTYWNTWVQIDPPVPQALVGLFEGNPATQTNKPFELVKEPLFTLSTKNGELASLYRALIKNDDTKPHTYTLKNASASSGFSIKSSLNNITVPPGQTGVLGIALVPNNSESLPPIGTNISTDISITSDDGGTITDSTTFTVPAITDIKLKLSQDILPIERGTTGKITLTIESTGNTDAVNVPLSLVKDSGLVITGLPATVSIAKGLQQRIPLTVTAPNGQLNQQLSFKVIAKYGKNLDGVPYQSAANAIVKISSKSAFVTEKYVICAKKQGHDQLYLNIKNIAEMITQLEQTPDNKAFLKRLSLLYKQLHTIASSTPTLSIYLPDILKLQQLAESEQSQLLIKTNMLFFKDKASTLCSRLAVRMSLPERILLEPSENTKIPVILKNTGERTIDLTLSLEPLVDKVKGTLTTSSIQLKPGEQLNKNSLNAIFINLSQEISSNKTVAVKLKATVTGVPNLTLRATTIVSIRNSYADVLSVAVKPNALASGTTKTKVTAIIANSANHQRDASAQLSIVDKNGNVLADLDTIDFVLTSGFDPLTLEFNDITLPKLSDGSYYMRLRLLDKSGKRIPGKDARTMFWIGKPVSATVSTQQSILPPGNQEVVINIDVNRKFNGAGSLGGFESTDPSLDRINWAAASKGSTITGRDNSNFLIDEKDNHSRYAFISSTQPIIVDLGTKRSFDEISFSIYAANVYFGYLIEVSEDGQQYNTIVNKPATAYNGMQWEKFPAVSARYVRFSGISKTNTRMYLEDEIRIIGDSKTVPISTQNITLDKTSASTQYSQGIKINLPAGIYEIKYLSGATSRFDNDQKNNGKTWEAHIRATLPGLNKSYTFGYLHDKISRYPTANALENSMKNKQFSIRLDARTDVYFHIPNNDTARGAINLRIKQISGPNNTLIARVKDAMTRSVLWEQTELAQWNRGRWISKQNRDCFGCHVQTQASVGLEISKQKIATLPIDDKLTNELIDSYKYWLTPNGSIPNRRPITKTSLWAWGVSEYKANNQQRIATDLLNSTDWLVNKQDQSGGWIADHSTTSARRVYTDGSPSATLTTGNLKAIHKAIEILKANNKLIEFDTVIKANNAISFTENVTQKFDISLDIKEPITGIMLEIKDTFEKSSNFVINELSLYEDNKQINIQSAIANRNERNYHINKSFNGNASSHNDGWAVIGDTKNNPAKGLWIFNTAQQIDQLSIRQFYDNTHQLKDFKIFYTTDTTPTLNSNFKPAKVIAVGLGGKTEKLAKYQAALNKVADLYSSSQWDYERNVRTAAQTILGLQAILPTLNSQRQQLAEKRINDVAAYLKSIQNINGGWGDKKDEISQPFYSAQALQALLKSSNNAVDANIIRAASYLLLSQRPSGDWSSGFRSTLGTTSRVQIALPTLFENFIGMNVSLAHNLPNDKNQASYVENSAVPTLSAGGGNNTNLKWKEVLKKGELIKQFTLKTAVPNLKPGETREISLSSLVKYESILGSDQITLPPIKVAGAHIINITPNKRDLNHQTPAKYDVVLNNPSNTDQVYRLSVLGLEDLSVELASSANVAANSTLTVPLIVTSKSGVTGSRAFEVTARTTTNGSDNAQAILNIENDAQDPNTKPPTPVDLDELSVDIKLTPLKDIIGLGGTASYIVTVTNMGDKTATFDISGSFPVGFTAKWSDTSLTIPPGTGGAKDIRLQLISAKTNTVKDYNFSVNASALDRGKIVKDDTEGKVTILPLGVDIDFAQKQLTPGNKTHIRVTNTGNSRDTFNLRLEGPAHMFASIESKSATLDKNESIDIAVNIAAMKDELPRQLALYAVATSSSKKTVQDFSAANVTIAAKRGVTAALYPEQTTINRLGNTNLTLVVNNTSNQVETYEATVINGKTLGLSPDWKAYRAKSMIIMPLSTNRKSRYKKVTFSMPPNSTIDIPYIASITQYGKNNFELAVKSTDGAISDTADTVIDAKSSGKAGFTVIESDGSSEVLESAGKDSISVILNKAPVGTVNLAVSAPDNDELSFSPKALSFDQTNWNQSQTINLLGIDDKDIDGNQTVIMTIAVTNTTSDQSYLSLASRQVSVLIKDDDKKSNPNQPPLQPPIQPVAVPNTNIELLLLLMMLMAGLMYQRNYQRDNR